MGNCLSNNALLFALFQTQIPSKWLNMSPVEEDQYKKTLLGKSYAKGKIYEQYFNPKSKATAIIYNPNSYVYIGEVKFNLSGQNIFHGDGFLLTSDGRSYQGRFKNGLIHGGGVITVTSKQGLHTFKGIWTNGKPTRGSMLLGDTDRDIIIFSTDDKKVEINLTNGAIYRGEAKEFDGKTKAHGKGEYELNKRVSVGDFREGFLEGKGKQNWSQGNTKYQFQGQFIKGIPEGQGTLESIDEVGKSVLEIEWKKGKPHGNGKIKVNGDEFVVKYEQGTKIPQQPSSIEA